MIVVLFRSRLTREAGSDYNNMAEEMLTTAKTMPGFIDFKSYQAEDGERISVIWWQDAVTLAQWKEHPRHRVAQAKGRAKWYEFYKIEVAEVIRENAFDRTPK